jgi:hypothetical protein
MDSGNHIVTACACPQIDTTMDRRDARYWRGGGRIGRDARRARRGTARRRTAADGRNLPKHASWDLRKWVMPRRDRVG